ncbi:RdgB/HAM1 family non-canonical purine NTP pyrophosphatase [Campylobacter sp. 2018MI35]|uniref:RdgB/HAM1 family non-canonical purine NTP pyrophosphatase n=1 Tax=Campylobacter sp. 2018MI34 TaxID=2800582 RepID=UPI0019089E23|nr:RdgB/HAM1 family non-canonical purine NTP pyrophosphatase [Campylobacter sp. 2018MI34]MBK1992043.1 RdgB/HAM1 family non-canonical purine NTP pyrophosphatase [Campylobacter sp. 2018MI34]
MFKNKIILATNNIHKVYECKNILTNYEVYAFGDIMQAFEIEENGISFKENALIKSRAVFNALSKDQQEEFIVLSDDSGICVEALDGRPGIYSARFSKSQNDEGNRKKLIDELQKKGIFESKAFYTAAIGISSKFGDLSSHGWMHGKVICEERGKNGFGYDPLFIPNGFTKTLAQLDDSCKNLISHRFKALNLAQILIKVLSRAY